MNKALNDFTAIDEAKTKIGEGLLPGLLGIEVLSVTPQETIMRMQVARKLLAPNGYLHAASVIGLADTAAGYGTIAALPKGAKGFTTIELKSNFTGTAREGTLLCQARPLHSGRMTQVWDAQVTHLESGKTIAHFRCTQMILFDALNECLS
ncbi:MAG: PaaI family thioesterase [Desulfobacteraceae bacterium]|nr:PaaI family thioesterase [Desulfobacteraceae bacterium]